MPDSSSNQPRAGGDDFIIVERRDAPRSVIGMAGHYCLNGWRESDGSFRKFPCQIRNMQPKVLTITAPVGGSVGEWVVASFDQLGTFEGPILQVLNRAFAMRIVATNEDRAKVAEKIAWLTDAARPEVRRFPRLTPADPHSAVALSARQITPCLIIDYSVGGAAVSSEVTPEMGAVVKIGRVLGRVVRHFVGGFAVAFLNLQQPDQIEKLIHDPMLE